MTAEMDPGLAWDVLARFEDPATAEFDAALAAAGLDPATARTLRFWQRESVANVRQYAAQALPAVLTALVLAETDVRDATERAAAVWQRAQPPTAATDRLVVLPEPDHVAVRTGRGAAEPSHELTEQRRRTVAARLTRLG